MPKFYKPQSEKIKKYKVGFIPHYVDISHPLSERLIEEFGFHLPAVEKNQLNLEVVDEVYKILTDPVYHNKVVKHNLEVLYRNLEHRIIADKLRPLIIKLFTQIIN